jgi:ATP synthase F1 epsilon subunit
MQVDLISFTGKKFSGLAQEVRLKTPNGSLVILPNHEPLTALTVASPITIVNDKGEEFVYATYGGLLEVDKNQVKVLSDEVEESNDLVASEVETALELARQMKLNAKDRHELHQAQSLIDRHTVRLEVSNIRRRKRNNR